VILGAVGRGSAGERPPDDVLDHLAFFRDMEVLDMKELVVSTATPPSAPVERPTVPVERPTAPEEVAP
jgi:hypothetical protein